MSNVWAVSLKKKKRFGGIIKEGPYRFLSAKNTLRQQILPTTLFERFYNIKWMSGTMSITKIETVQE